MIGVVSQSPVQAMSTAMAWMIFWIALIGAHNQIIQAIAVDIACAGA
jgi:hypothetical protein